MLLAVRFERVFEEILKGSSSERLMNKKVS